MNKKNLLIAGASALGVFVLLFAILSLHSEKPASSSAMVGVIQKVTTDELLPATDAYNRATEDQRPELLKKTVSLSEERKQTMLELMRTDPAAAAGIVM